MRYLLDDLSDDERTQIEERYFNDDEALEELEIVEGELVDRYVRGELSENERQKFERNIAVSQRLRERVEFGRLLEARISVLDSPATAHVATSYLASNAGKQTWTSSFGRVFRERASLRLALAFGTLLLFVTIAFVVWQQLRRPEARFTSAPTTDQPQPTTSPATGQNGPNDNQQTASETKSPQVSPEQPRSNQPTIASIVLSGGATRGGGSRSELILTQFIKTVQVKLNLGNANYPEFAVNIRTVEGKEISRLKVKSQKAGGLDVITLQLPATRLSPGHYTIHVDGITSEGLIESVEDYQFRVRR
jgi:hypothetical protein